MWPPILKPPRTFSTARRLIDSGSLVKYHIFSTNFSIIFLVAYTHILNTIFRAYFQHHIFIIISILYFQHHIISRASLSSGYLATFRQWKHVLRIYDFHYEPLTKPYKLWFLRFSMELWHWWRSALILMASISTTLFLIKNH